MPEMSKYSQGTESYQQFAIRIADMLLDDEKFKELYPILQKAGFNLMIKEIMQTREEVHKLLIEASKAPNHPLNNVLNAHFEERKRLLEALKNEKLGFK